MTVTLLYIVCKSCNGRECFQVDFSFSVSTKMLGLHLWKEVGQLVAVCC